MDSLLVFSTAFLLSLILIPFTITFAKKWGFMDNPQKHKHPAQLLKKPVAKAGGFPIFIAIFLALGFFLPFDKHLWGIFLGGAIIVLGGLLDDKFNIHPIWRLLLQFLAAGTVIVSGIGITEITNPFGGMIRLDSINIPVQLFGEHHILILADLFALLWIVWTMNMVNWSSGVDGQMPGFIVIAATTLVLLALPFTAYDPSQWAVVAIGAAISGACLGFLIFNWNPAKIHPGDSASMLLGFLLAALAIFSGGKIATALLVLGIPTLDALYVISRRIYQKKNPIWGDRGHLHHKLLDLGLSQKQVAIFYWILALALGIIALLSSGREKLLALLLLGGILAFFLVLINVFLAQKPKTKKND